MNADSYVQSSNIMHLFVVNNVREEEGSPFVPERGQNEQTGEETGRRRDRRRGDLELVRLDELAGMDAGGHSKRQEEEGHPWGKFSENGIIVGNSW